MNSSWILKPIHYEFIIFFADPLWLYYICRESFIHSFSQAHFQLTIESRIYCEFPNNFAIILNLTIFFANLLSISRKCLEFTICFAITLWIHYRFREFTMNSLLLFGNSLLIYLLYYEFTLNSVDFWRTYFAFTIYYATSLWSCFVFREYTLNSLFIHLVFRDSLWIYLLFQGSLWVHFLFRGIIIFFAN